MWYAHSIHAHSGMLTVNTSPKSSRPHCEVVLHRAGISQPQTCHMTLSSFAQACGSQQGVISLLKQELAMSGDPGGGHNQWTEC